MEDLSVSESYLENILEQQDKQITLLKMRVEVLERIVVLLLEDKLKDPETKRLILEKWKETIAKTSN